MSWLKSLKGLIANNKCHATDGGLVACVDALRVLTGKLLSEQMRHLGPYHRLADAEFKVFSQFGDDGIIQYLINTVDVEDEMFIEFGVENYTESNTRFLLVNNNWSGLVIDGNIRNVEYIVGDPIYWRHDLIAVNAFVAVDNINEILAANCGSSEPGLLSIDIDGNDYWIWRCIRAIHPIIVIIEYNSIFGSDLAITVPYDPGFQRTKSHYSNLYWGASLKALVQASNEKGYAFVGCNRAGNNAYFVRRDKLGKIREVGLEEGYVLSRFRESRDQRGNLTYLRGGERLKAIEDMVVLDVTRNRTLKIRDLL